MDILSSIWNLAVSGGQLVPLIVTIIEVLKRFIPDQYRTWANPVLAIVLGVAGVYITGGVTEVVNILMAGLLAAAGAIGTYKLPKMLGVTIGTEEKPIVVAGVKG